MTPKDSGRGDYLGGFAVTTGIGADELAKQFSDAHDDYNAILVKALADRLAEAFAEYLHQEARIAWGFGGDEKLSHEELIRERYRGIRPAAGYPASPDHTEKPLLFDLLRPEENAGVVLTESFAMHPGASVSGLVLCPSGSEVFRRRQNRARSGTRLCRSKGPGRADRGKVAFAKFGLLTHGRVVIFDRASGIALPPPCGRTMRLPRGFAGPDHEVSGNSLPNLHGPGCAQKGRRYSTERRHERCYDYYGFYSPACPSFIGSSPASSSILLLMAGASFGASVNLAWDHNAEPDIAGYHVLLGVASGQYTQSIDAGPATTATVSNLSPGTTYFFAVTAYNTSGFESLPSSEVSYSVPGGPTPTTPTPTPLQLRRHSHQLQHQLQPTPTPTPTTQPNSNSDCDPNPNPDTAAIAVRNVLSRSQSGWACIGY